MKITHLFLQTSDNDCSLSTVVTSQHFNMTYVHLRLIGFLGVFNFSDMEMKSGTSKRQCDCDTISLFVTSCFVIEGK